MPNPDLQTTGNVFDMEETTMIMAALSNERRRLAEVMQNSGMYMPSVPFQKLIDRMAILELKVNSMYKAGQGTRPAPADPHEIRRRFTLTEEGAETLRKELGWDENEDKDSP